MNSIKSGLGVFFNILSRIICFFTHKKNFRLTMFILGFASGLPFLLTLSTLNLWLAESKINIFTIGMFTLIHFPYSVKFIITPFINLYKIPYLSLKIGHYRSWLLISVFVVFIGLILMSLCDPLQNLYFLALSTFVVVLATGVQDSTLYYYQVFNLEDNKHGSYAAANTLGWRVGFLVGGSGAIYLASYFSWNFSYKIMAILCLANGLLMLALPSPKNNLKVQKFINLKRKDEWYTKLYKTLMVPLKLLRQFDNYGLIILFIILYKIGDSLVHTMVNSLYLTLGYTKEEIASVVKVFGMCTEIMTTIVAGYINNKLRAYRSVLICGFLHISAIFLYLLLIRVGYNMKIFCIIVAVSNSTNLLMTSSLVVYFYSLKSMPVGSAAILYSFLWAVSSLSRTLVGSFSGYFVNMLGWCNFIIFAALISYPSLVIFYYIYRDKIKKC